MNTRERIELSRDCDAIQIPDGIRTRLPAGSSVLLAQELGGSYTVIGESGGLYRIDARDADALGKTVDPALLDSNREGPLEERVWAQMRRCYDPEIPVNIVDLGLIYDCRTEPLDSGGHRVAVKMTLTAPGCGMGPVLAQDVKTRIEEIEGVEEAHVEVVFDPPWNPNMMTEAARLELGLL